MRPRLRAQRGRPLIPKDPHYIRDLAEEEWIFITVPALVAPDLFETVAQQLAENRQRARIGQRGARYLLQGLLVCGSCGYAYYGKQISPSGRKGHFRSYAYYHCIGADAHRFGGVRLCYNKQVRTDLLEMAVWEEEITKLLEDPSRLEQEYRRRLEPRESSGELRAVEGQVSKLSQGINRLIDSYAEGIIERTELEPRLGRLRERIEHLEDQAQQLAEQGAAEAEIRLLIGRIEDFAESVRENLKEVEWSKQREIIRTVVKRVEIFKENVKVVFRVGISPPGNEGGVKSLQHCKRSTQPVVGKRIFERT